MHNNETFSFIMLYNSYVRWGGGGGSPIEEHTWDRIHIRWCVCEGGTVIFTQNLYLVTYWHYDKRSIFALDKIYISRIYMCCCTVKLILLPIWVQFSSLVPSFTTLCSFTRGWLSNISCLSMWFMIKIYSSLVSLT